MGELRYRTAIQPSFSRHSIFLRDAVNQSRSFTAPTLLRTVLVTALIDSRSFITVNFYTPKGEKKTVKAEPGESILRIAQHNDIPLEGMVSQLDSIQALAKEEWRARRAT